MVTVCEICFQQTGCAHAAKMIEIPAKDAFVLARRYLLSFGDRMNEHELRRFQNQLTMLDLARAEEMPLPCVDEDGRQFWIHPKQD